MLMVTAGEEYPFDDVINLFVCFQRYWLIGILDGGLPFSSIEMVNVLLIENPTLWWMRERLPNTTTTNVPTQTIGISTRNALDNQALPEVTVEYSIQGIRLGSVITGPDGIAVITPRYAYRISGFILLKLNFYHKSVIS